MAGLAMRAMDVLINGRQIGTLIDDRGIWSFTYYLPWLASDDAFPLNAALLLRAEAHIDSSSDRPVQWYFDNLLPEENARQLLARDAKVDLNDAFSLLAFYGAESAGSLTLLLDQSGEEAGGERPLSDAQLQRRIEDLPTVSLVANAPKRMSMAGAQHKLALIYREPELFEPVGATPSTHILKPNHGTDDYRDSVINEFFTMRVAQEAGLPVPTVWRRYVPAPVYLIERFDRRMGPRGVERLHAIDACQLLNLDRQFKYAAASIKSLARLADACSAPAAARLQLYRWFVFNLLIGNNDAHLKNLSFLVDRDGTRLAPHYDMLSTAVYHTRAMDKDSWPNCPLSWPFGGLQRFDQVDRAAVIGAGVELGLRAETAMRLLDLQLKSVPLAAAKVYQQIEQENMALQAARPGLAAVFGSELRTVRSIDKLIVHDMVAKLSVQ